MMRTYKEKLDSLSDKSVWCFAKQDVDFMSLYKATEIFDSIPDKRNENIESYFNNNSERLGFKCNHRMLSSAQLFGLLTKNDSQYKNQEVTNVFKALKLNKGNLDFFNTIRTEQLFKFRINALIDRDDTYANYSIYPMFYIFDVFWKLHLLNIESITIEQLYTYVLTCQSHDELEESVAFISESAPTSKFVSAYQSLSRIETLINKNSKLFINKNGSISLNPNHRDFLHDVFYIGDNNVVLNMMNNFVKDIDMYKRILTDFQNFNINIFNDVPFIQSNVYEVRRNTEYVGDKLSNIANLDSVSNTHLSLLTALRTKPFLLLAGISGTGKSRIVRELAFSSCPTELQDADGTTPGNYCMIEVKPNWHDSSELLGYYSNISKKYIFTKFVKFLVKAKMYPTVPFFVCLDEMNLAPVEQYFAEFLSVLETRKKVDGVIKTGALVDANWFSKSYELFDPFVEVGLDKIGQEVSTMEVEKAQTSVTTEQYDRQDIVDDLKEHGLTLPDNVFVIGTVNMDDTTHQFSRKVIDRAMTIEMNGGDLMDMFGGSAKLSYLEEKDVLPLEVFRPRYVNADEVLAAHQDCEEQVRKQTTKWLGSINACLKSTPFEVSYRVLNELVIYLGNLLDENNYQGKGEDDEFKALVDTAVDRITLMKILPRVEGDEDMFEVKGDTKNRLEKLQELFTSSTSKDTTPTLSKDEDENSEDANESENTPSSHEKLQYMIERLESGFTRFWP